MRTIACLLACLLLNGCSSLLEARQPVLQNADDGAVVMRVLSNSPFVVATNHANRKWCAAGLGIEGESVKQYSIAPVFQDGSLLTSVFAGSLPPGHYRVTGFGCPYTPGLVVSDKFSHFEIQPGKLTDLGTIVATRSAVSYYQFELSHSQTIDPDDSRTLIREAAPALQKLLDQPILSWPADSMSGNNRAALLASMAQAYGRQSPQETAQGDFLFASVNGTVERWRPGRGWAMSDLQQRSAVGALLITDNGDWVAGGDLGLLKLSTDEGKTWRSVRGNMSYGATLDLHQWKDQIIATTARGGEVRVYSAALRSSDWKLLAKYTLTGSLYFDTFSLRPQSFLSGDRLITSLPRNHVAVLDLVSGESTEQELPSTIKSFSISPGDVLHLNSMGLTGKYLESRDYGKTWSVSPNPHPLYLPSFKDNLHGVAYERIPLSKPRLMYTDDGGATWIESQIQLEDIGTMFWSRDGKTAYAVTQMGSAWKSIDNGKNWEVAN